MTVLPELGLVRSSDLDDVLAAVDDDHAPYAGGTELVPAMGLGLRRPAAIVDLKRVEALKGIEVDAEAGSITIGAAVTHRRLSDHPAVQEHLPTLAGAASRVGNARVRSTGTVGGNLCFAEPRSDLGCVLVALGATAEVRSSRGARTMPIDELIVGAFETSLAEDEILTAVTVPFEPPGMSYWKLQSYERPTLGVALVVTETQWEITVGRGHRAAHPGRDRRWRHRRAGRLRRRARAQRRHDRPARLQAVGVAGLSGAGCRGGAVTVVADYERSVLRVYLERVVGVGL